MEIPGLSSELGSRVWVSTGIAAGQLVVTEGDTVQNLPNILEGFVTAPTLASDGSTRIIEFDFRVALNEDAD